MGSYIKKKMAKTKVLLKSKRLRPHIPETVWMNKRSLKEMLDRYGMVYVKPNVGMHGKGVIRVEMRGRPDSVTYQFQKKMTIRTSNSYSDFYAMLHKRAVGGPRYLVQRGIHLLKYRGRPFDIRVMVQRGRHGKWVPTAMIGRVAQKERVVTNYHSGGTPKPVERLMAKHLKRGDAMKRFRRKLERLGVATARQLTTRYKDVRQIGLDVALAEDHHPWILEVNTRPDPYLFRFLKQPKVHRRVLRFARANGSIKRSRIRSVRALSLWKS